MPIDLNKLTPELRAALLVLVQQAAAEPKAGTEVPAAEPKAQTTRVEAKPSLSPAGVKAGITVVEGRPYTTRKGVLVKPWGFKYPGACVYTSEANALAKGPAQAAAFKARGAVMGAAVKAAMSK